MHPALEARSAEPRLAQVAWAVQDLARAARFYAEGLGFRRAGGRLLWGLVLAPPSPLGPRRGRSVASLVARRRPGLRAPRALRARAAARSPAPAGLAALRPRLGARRDRRRGPRRGARARAPHRRNGGRPR